MFDLSEKLIALTGSEGRIGRVLRRGLRDAGATVLGLDVVPGADYRVDIADAPLMANACNEIVAEHGIPSVLVNAAAVFREWEDCLRVNLLGTWTACCTFAEIMDPGGSVVLIGSTYGLVSPDPRIYGNSGLNARPEYSATKAGVVGLMRYLACHWAPRVRVNCLVPGGVETGQNEGFVERYGQRVPLSRMARAEELVGPTVFLASGASSYVTGAVLVVDGGWTAW